MKYEATKVDCSEIVKEEGSIKLGDKTYSSTQNKCSSYVYEAGSIELKNVLEPAPAIPDVDPILANNNVADISAIANYISANALTSDDVYNEFGWSLGDSIPITLSTGE